MSRVSPAQAMLRQLIDEALQTARKGVTALTAARNNALGVTQTPAPAAGGSGNILNNSIVFTPRVSGKVLVSWVVSGPADTGARLVSFAAFASAAFSPAIDFAPGGDPAHTVAASGSYIFQNLVVGTPVNINVAWQTDAGTWGPTGSHGNVNVVELP